MDEEWLSAANAAVDFASANAQNLPEGHPSAFEYSAEQAFRENDKVIVPLLGGVMIGLVTKPLVTPTSVFICGSCP